MKRGHADYGPLTHRRMHRQWHLLRTARLNVVGWLALVGLCALIGLVAALIGKVFSWSRPVTGASGAILALAGVLALDRKRWAGMSTSISWTHDPAEVRSVVQTLQRRGVPVVLVIGEEGEPRLLYRNRDVRRVRAVLDPRDP